MGKFGDPKAILTVCSDADNSLRNRQSLRVVDVEHCFLISIIGSVFLHRQHIWSRSLSTDHALRPSYRSNFDISTDVIQYARRYGFKQVIKSVGNGGCVYPLVSRYSHNWLRFKLHHSRTLNYRDRICLRIFCPPSHQSHNRLFPL